MRRVIRVFSSHDNRLVPEKMSVWSVRILEKREKMVVWFGLVAREGRDSR